MAARLTALAAASFLALPAIAGAQAAASLRGFLVYFDLDSAELTEGGAGIVRDFAEIHALQPVSRIIVVAHADTAGEAAHNRALSQQRARRIADALAEEGVDPAIIMLDPRGESEPAVPTGDGVAEQLNRRAEIVYLK